MHLHNFAFSTARPPPLFRADTALRALQEVRPSSTRTTDARPRASLRESNCSSFLCRLTAA